MQISANTRRTKNSKGGLTLGDYQALAGFRHSLRKFQMPGEAAAASAGLMPQQHQALLAIKALTDTSQAPSIGEVADCLVIRHHSAVELVGRLFRRGLVKRNRDPDDRRRVRISLTARAEKKLEALKTAHLDERRAIRSFLVQLLGRFEK